MNKELENYYLKQPEPIQSCLLALKSIILSVSKEISQRRMYQIPFFYYRDKKIAFLWVNRKRTLFGIVTDKSILEFPEGTRRKDSYESIAIDPNEDIPVEDIVGMLRRQMNLYDQPIV
jgi:hypothetical protein